MVTMFYRYVGDAEKQFIDQNAMIRSGSGRTYFTPDVYASATEAQQKLALPRAPAWRVGPLAADEIPDFDAAALQSVHPNNGQPGGGTDCATTQPVHLFGSTRLH